MFFQNRRNAGHQLASKLRDRSLQNPLVLAIPRGGVAVGGALAHDLGAELDVVLSRKIRAPRGGPELVIGAISEDGWVHLNHNAQKVPDLTDYLAEERRRQLDEIGRSKELFRTVRPKAAIAGRSVIVTDDGIATGSTMIAALQVVKSQSPRHLIVAIPVAPPDRIGEVQRRCDELVCLHAPEVFWSIADFYADFSLVTERQAVELLRAALCGSQTQPAG